MVLSYMVSDTDLVKVELRQPEMEVEQPRRRAVSPAREVAQPKRSIPSSKKKRETLAFLDGHSGFGYGRLLSLDCRSNVTYFGIIAHQ